MVTDREIQQIIVESRLFDPDRPRKLAKTRTRPTAWEQRPLVLIAADHPARRTVAAPGDPWAMANRADLLRRVARVLMQPFVDGLLATPDIMDELWILEAWVTSRGGPNFLDDKILIGSMNRAGLADTVFGLDDFVTAYTTDALVESGMDAGKLLLRLDPKSEASSRTLKYVVEALQALDAVEIPVFLEPLSVPMSVDAMVRLMGVASALGPSSSRRWLKVPMVTPFKRVAEATTCPLVLLGGADPGGTETILEQVRSCLNEGPQVRGILMGRGILYPQDGTDPRKILGQLAALLGGHENKERVEWPDL